MELASSQRVMGVRLLSSALRGVSFAFDAQQHLHHQDTFACTIIPPIAESKALCPRQYLHVPTSRARDPYASIPSTGTSLSMRQGTRPWSQHLHMKMSIRRSSKMYHWLCYHPSPWSMISSPTPFKIALHTPTEAKLPHSLEQLKTPPTTPPHLTSPTAPIYPPQPPSPPLPPLPHP